MVVVVVAGVVVVRIAGGVAVRVTARVAVRVTVRVAGGVAVRVAGGVAGAVVVVSKRERRKGLEGEREVAAIWRDSGFDVRGLEGEGDHTVIIPGRACPGSFRIPEARLHSEVKPCETTRPWPWYEQASREAPAGAVPVVAFRRSRSPWLALIALKDLARLLA